MALLTTARLAAWNAIDKSPLLTSADTESGHAFRQRMRFDDADADLLSDTEPTGISDFPCLAVRPTTIDPAWFTMEMMDFVVILQCQFWTAGWNLREPEQLVENLWRSLYKMGPDGLTSSVSYIKATGYHPKLLKPINFDFVRLGKDSSNGVKATRVTLRVGLRTQQDPFA